MFFFFLFQCDHADVFVAVQSYQYKISDRVHLQLTAPLKYTSIFPIHS